MWSFTQPINLIRYLIVWQVNRTLVRMPRSLPVELSRVLGALIAERLPTQEAAPWRKALTKWEGYDADPKKNATRTVAPVPAVAWPVESVLFTYPTKWTYGQGEQILWELKLIGNSAEHGQFLQVILPAMEDASRTNDPRWARQHSLWGRFDIQAIYAARGARWEPVAREGKLDLRCRVTPTQWAEGLTFRPESERTLDRLTWITPFEFPPDPTGQANLQSAHAPTLPDLLEALAERMSLFIPSKRHTHTDVWNVLSEEEQTALRAAIKQARGFPLRKQALELASKGAPGKWTGTQKFLFIPDALIPYLELASILHIGQQTHFGCGTFVIE